VLRRVSSVNTVIDCDWQWFLSSPLRLYWLWCPPSPSLVIKGALFPGVKQVKIKLSLWLSTAPWRHTGGLEI
jgi:hypothetical protein